MSCGCSESPDLPDCPEWLQPRGYGLGEAHEYQSCYHGSISMTGAETMGDNDFVL